MIENENDLSSDAMPSSLLKIRICAVDETGMNSVSPSMMPSRNAWKRVIISFYHKLRQENSPGAILFRWWLISFQHYYPIYLIRSEPVLQIFPLQYKFGSAPLSGSKHVNCESILKSRPTIPLQRSNAVCRRVYKF